MNSSGRAKAPQPNNLNLHKKTSAMTPLDKLPADSHPQTEESIPPERETWVLPGGKQERIMTIGEVYGGAAKVKTKEGAKDCFERIVDYHMKVSGAKNREEVSRIVRSSLTYYLGYYNPEVRKKALNLFFGEEICGEK